MPVNYLSNTVLKNFYPLKLSAIRYLPVYTLFFVNLIVDVTIILFF
jgi:hypothetical protein